MYTSSSRQHRQRTESGRTRRYEHNAGRQATLQALERETDRELRLAVRGTWAELELSADETGGHQ